MEVLYLGLKITSNRQYFFVHQKSSHTRGGGLSSHGPSGGTHGFNLNNLVIKNDQLVPGSFKQGVRMIN
jgi:hypothetical protein